MDTAVELWETPAVEEKYLIAGWRQWADAGSISSGLPQYLIDWMGARKIGQIKPDNFHLFQIPGAHHFLRPEIKLEEGYVQEIEARRNEFFYAGHAGKGLVIFLGDEPHLDVERYAQAFLDAVEALGVSRVVTLGGVYGAMPYDRDREVSCVYSLWNMKEELAKYAVRFSNYEGGATIDAYLTKRAEQRGLEFVAFYSFIPAYEFPQISTSVQGVRIENDFRAWYEMMRRLNYMFQLGMDLSDLEQQSADLITSMETRLDELSRKAPQLNVRAYLKQLTEQFTETSFIPLDEGVWEGALENLFDDSEG